MRFSLRVNNDLSVRDLTALALAAEDAGFDQLWVSHDLLLRSAPALVAALAVRTTHLQLGIAVVNPYSAHVAELAMSAATLAEISEGRFSLGVGAGAAEFLAWVGLGRAAPLETTAHAVAALRRMLGHDDVADADLPGWFSDAARLRFAVPAPVPVYVGAMGPKMLAMAGRLADGVLPLLYPPETFPQAREQVLAGVVAAGRDAEDVDLPACFWVSVSADAVAGRAALAEKLAYYGPSISAQLLAGAGLVPGDFAPAAALAQSGRSAAALVDDRMLALGVAGDADDVVARCAGLVELGARHLSFGPPLGPDPVAAVAHLGDHVLPRLRGRRDDVT